MDISPRIKKIFDTSLTKDELWRFQDVEKQQANIGKERYGLLPQKNVFLLKDDDILRLSLNADDINIEIRSDGLHLQAGVVNSIFDIKYADLVKKVIDQVANPSSLIQIKSALANRCEPLVTKTICEQLLGVCIEIPDTIAALEKALPLNGLLRFPVHSPYKVPRAYWENSVALRQALPLLYETCNSKENFPKAIAGLHRLATVGETGNNFYGGSGGVATEPGSYRQHPIKTTITRWHLRSLEWWLQFLKVPTKLIKEGVITSLGNRPMVEIQMDGLHCVHLYGNEGHSLFELLDEARENLNNCLRLSHKNTPAILGNLARFLQLFSISHPFNNINASIAMNIVNDILEKRGLGSLPHLYFDYMAQRIRPNDFSLFFFAAFKEHRLVSTPNQDSDRNGEGAMKELLNAAATFLDAEKANFAI